jgi:hypothetical protein
MDIFNLEVRFFRSFRASLSNALPGAYAPGYILFAASRLPF